MNRIRYYCKNVQKNVSFKNLTSIKIGGKAKYVTFPNSESELKNLIAYLNKREIKYYVLGNGSNTLACDGKYKGVIIKLSSFNALYCHKNFIHAGAGCTLANLIKFAIANSLAGLEEASGIPGTVGGAVKMNAGAFNFEMAKVVRGVYVLREDNIVYLKNKECKFGYRSSGFLDGDIIISADFKLSGGDQKELLKRQQEVLALRKSLPKYPSLGSVFKRQEGVIVSKLLDEMKFKGVTFGGAMVSKEHAGIIVNVGDATSEDVKDLINYIKKRCFLEKNIVLEEEIKFLDN